MIRPGSSVNSPAMTSAPEKISDHDRGGDPRRRCRCACHTPSGSVTSVKIDSRWIGLQGPQQPDLVDPERARRPPPASGRPRSSPGCDGATFPSARQTGRCRARTPPSPQRHEAGSGGAALSNGARLMANSQHRRSEAEVQCHSLSIAYEMRVDAATPFSASR